jgi:signal transduction histidine kinase
MSETGTREVEQRSIGRALSERVLVRAPTGDDAATVADILGERGFEVVTLQDLAALEREWRDGAGVLLLASEALADTETCSMMRHLLDAQDPWSEIPVVLLGGGAEDEAALVAELLGDRAQLLILERPLGIATFASAVEGALRSRRRQYQVKRLLDELAASAVALTQAHEKADRAKDEFLATLAHELRSPMTAIRGWIQMLKMGDLDSAEATDAVSMIESSIKVQAHILEDLMDVSRILAGKVMIEPAAIPLAPVVANIVATFRPAAAQEGIELTEDIAQDPLIVFADDVRLQQIAWNLLSNAIKFTPRGGSVRVILAREDANAVIRVRDTGQGIAHQLLPHVFERYRQDESNGGKAHHGLGLGLAIVRHLVESHGGAIQALSEGPGKGAEFVVSLPLREA